MRKSNIIVDINLKNDTVSIAKLQNGEFQVGKPIQAEHAPAIVHAFDGVTTVLQGVLKAGKGGQRISIIVPEAIAIRMNEARKFKDAGAEEIATNLFKAWMAESNDSEAYERAIGEFASVYEQFVEVNGNNHQFVNARMLYRYELTGNLDAIGETIKLNNSVNEELGVSVKAVNDKGNLENNMLTGTFTVMNRSYRNRSGETIEQKFVIRKVQVIDKNGSPITVDTTKVLSLLDSGEVTPNESADAANALINALKLRALNIKLGLPHVTVIAKVPTVAADGTLAF